MAVLKTWGGVLTDAPLKTAPNKQSVVQCANCSICLDVCQPNALKGTVAYNVKI